MSGEVVESVLSSGLSRLAGGEGLGWMILSSNPGMVVWVGGAWSPLGGGGVGMRGVQDSLLKSDPVIGSVGLLFLDKGVGGM